MANLLECSHSHQTRVERIPRSGCVGTRPPPFKFWRTVSSIDDAAGATRIGCWACSCPCPPISSSLLEFLPANAFLPAAPRLGLRGGLAGWLRLLPGLAR